MLPGSESDELILLQMLPWLNQVTQCLARVIGGQALHVLRRELRMAALCAWLPVPHTQEPIQPSPHLTEGETERQREA